jgi:hypothetical protein
MLAMVLVAMSIIAWLIMVPFKNAIAEAEERAPVIRLYQSVHNRVTLNSSLNSTSAQLVDLQDQLATRMDLHHSVMSTNLDNFTTTLISITDEMDQSVEHLQLLRNLILVGARRSYLYWDQAASLLVDFKIQLRDPTISKELRLKVESIAEMAGIMEVEMKDMELFMKDMERKVAMALKKADSIVVAAEQMVQNSAEKPSGSLQQPLRASPYADNPLSTDKSSESPTPQSLQWSWDSYKDGQVVSTLGKYTPLQQRLIECMFPLPFPPPFYSTQLLTKNYPQPFSQSKTPPSPTRINPPSSATASASLTPTLPSKPSFASLQTTAS